MYVSMPAKKRPVHTKKKVARKSRRICITSKPIHSSADDSGGDGETSEEAETDSVTIPAGGTTGPTSTATTTTTSTATSASVSVAKKPRNSGFLSEEDERQMIEWLQENSFIYDMKSKQYKDKSGKTTVWQEQADKLGFEVRCLLTWYESVRTRYGKLVARPSGSGAQLTDREKWILDNLQFIKPYIHRVRKKTPVSLKGKITATATATGEDAASSVADKESPQDIQERHEEDIADINLVLDGREQSVETPTPGQATSSYNGGKKKTQAQKVKEQDYVFFTHMKERADATAKFRADIMAAAVTLNVHVSSPKKAHAARSGFCNWFESVAVDLHSSLWPSFKKKITPILMSFDEQNDRLQNLMSSTSSTPTTKPQHQPQSQPQSQSRAQSQTSTSAHRQQATYQPVSSAYMSQQPSRGRVMCDSGVDDWDLEHLCQFPQQHTQDQRPRSMPEPSTVQSQRFAGYGAAYYGGYSGSDSGSYAASHTGSLATDGPMQSAFHVHQGSSPGQSRLTVISGEQDDSLLDMTMSNPADISHISSPNDVDKSGDCVKPISRD